MKKRKAGTKGKRDEKRFHLETLDTAEKMLDKNFIWGLRERERGKRNIIKRVGVVSS